MEKFTHSSCKSGNHAPVLMEDPQEMQKGGENQFISADLELFKHKSKYAPFDAEANKIGDKTCSSDPKYILRTILIIENLFPKFIEEV